MPRASGSRALAVAAVLAASTLARGAAAQHRPLPTTLVALDSTEGQRLFEEADARADYWNLSEQYVTQRSGNFCGVASGVMVLGALQVTAPMDDQLGAPAFTQDSFFNECARRVLSPTLMPGMTIDQLADLLQCHPATAHAVHAADTTLADFRALAAKNLATAGDYLIVNYDRAGLGQEHMGHISPLGAYDAKADKFLVLDVARYKYPPVWADAAALFAAMSTDDFVSGKTRGFVVASAAPVAPGPVGARTARNPIHIAEAIGLGLFLLGVALGAGVQTWRLKRRYRAKASTQSG
ncbi:MAG TPA: phytochelatin synthase family protein [Polyangiaceae bacterium]|nr:phytochelatin synthase family protein [Polyangiaceae bacterium]